MRRVLAFIISIQLVGCKEQSAKELYSQTKIMQLAFSDAIYENWENAEEIDSEQLWLFFCYRGTNAKCNCKYDEYGAYYHTEECVENYLKDYFPVSSEQIQKYQYYDKMKKTYYEPGGLGGSRFFKDITPVKNEDTITVTVSHTDPEDKIVGKSTITIEKINGDYKYTSCKYEKFD